MFALASKHPYLLHYKLLLQGFANWQHSQVTMKQFFLSAPGSPCMYATALSYTALQSMPANCYL